MKTKVISFKHKSAYVLSNLILISVIFSFMFISCSGLVSKHQVYYAYMLRMDGHADSAKALLLELTESNPENSMAWYELARTTEHLGMANPQAIGETIDEALKYSNKAVKNDPGNAMYLSFKGSLEALKFYLALQMGKDDPAEYLAKVEETYNAVYQLDPSYSENKLTLVEFFGGLPEEVGGNRDKAEKYAQELQTADAITAAKAQEILMPEDADYEKFWVEVVKDNPENADAVQALGRIYLFNDNIQEAEKQYYKAMELDPSKNDLYIDLGRYYMMLAMQDPTALDSIKPIIEEHFNKFLKSTPEPLKPMKAWVYATLSMISRHSGNMKEAEKYMEHAKEMDPFFSPSFGKPSMALYSPPDEALHEQGYYLTPF